MSKSKTCDQCGSLLSKKEQYRAIAKQIGIDKVGKAKERLCKMCFDSWVNHEKECQNPSACLQFVSHVSGNTVHIIDARNADERTKQFVVETYGGKK